MPINTGNLAKMLWPGLNDIYGHKYDEYPEEYTQIFEQKDSTKNFEEFIGLTGYGMASVKPEGSPITYDSEQQGFLTRFNHAVYATGFIITEEMIDDDQYMVTGKRRTEGLAYSMNVTCETVHANVLNRAFNTAYPGGDSTSLIASAAQTDTSHPNVSGGSWTNGPITNADLSEGVLEQAVIDIGNFQDDRGKQMRAMTKRLIIRHDNQFESERILGSTLRVDTTNNDINAIKSLGFIPEVTVNHFLLDTDAWFVQTNVPHGLCTVNRKAMAFNIDDEFDTGNVKFKVTKRFSAGWIDPRCLYGSSGA